MLYMYVLEIDYKEQMQYLLQILHSTSAAWLLTPLECSPQNQNGWMLRFCFWGWIMWKMYNKTIIEFGFVMISWIINTSCLCYLPQPSDSADNTDLGFDNSWYHAQPHPIIVYYHHTRRDHRRYGYIINRAFFTGIYNDRRDADECLRYHSRLSELLSS